MQRLAADIKQAGDLANRAPLTSKLGQNITLKKNARMHRSASDPVAPNSKFLSHGLRLYYSNGGGCEVWQPIHTSPPSKCSFFQIGTTSFSRSIANRHASKASARCAAEIAIATEVSPISTTPTRCAIAMRTIFHRSSASLASLRISERAIGS